MKYLVSIIIPVYNSEKYIEQTLRSCLSQSYTNIELVIINDGSNDISEKIIFHTIKDISSNRIKYLYQNNEGLCAARNKGIALAEGYFVLFLDSDDLLFPNSIQLLVSAIADYDVVIGSWNDFDSESQKILHEVKYESDINDNCLVSYLRHKPTVSTSLLRKSSLIFWDKTLRTWDVTKYFLDLFAMHRTFKFINKTVTSIRQHNSPNRLSILNNHFEPSYSSSFFVDCKKLLKNSGFLNEESEKILDKEIINYIYKAYQKENDSTCRTNFSYINLNLVNRYPEFARYGLYYFIHFFRGIKGLIIFKKINTFLGRT